jgi:hypothetical protein
MTTVPLEDYDLSVHCCSVQSMQADKADVRSTIRKNSWLTCNKPITVMIKVKEK